MCTIEGVKKYNIVIYLLIVIFMKWTLIVSQMGRAKRIWYLSPMRAATVQGSLRIRAVSPEPPLLAHTSSESRGTFRQKTRSLAPLNGWACAVKMCHDGMLEDTNSLVAAHMIKIKWIRPFKFIRLPTKFLSMYTFATRVPGNENLQETGPFFPNTSEK